MKENISKVAFIGPPNVGKSTLFNALTGLNVHTGNWAGKTVESEKGFITQKKTKKRLSVIDLPGARTLINAKGEEKVTRDFLIFNEPSAIICVADAQNPEPGLRVAREAAALYGGTERIFLCLNLTDEAERKGIKFSVQKLCAEMQMPVFPVCAFDKKQVFELKEKIFEFLSKPPMENHTFFDSQTENALMFLTPYFENSQLEPKNKKFFRRAFAFSLLSGDESIFAQAERRNLCSAEEWENYTEQACLTIEKLNLSKDEFLQNAVENMILYAKSTASKAFSFPADRCRVNLADRLMCRRPWGIIFIFLTVALILYLTLWGANKPSALLEKFFESAENFLATRLLNTAFPKVLTQMLIFGCFRTVGKVIAVMLPPTAVFFPLFSLAEDIGLLPRTAFNTDSLFRRSGSSGMQFLTMCMGMGCTACGVTGCRIIKNEKQKRAAVLTNSLMPCNGKFPILIALIFAFFTPDAALGAIILTGFLLFAFVSTLILNFFLLKSDSEHKTPFLLELPPYRPPKIGRVLFRALVDRTAKVLLRAVCAAAPAGILIWFLTEYSPSALKSLIGFLDPVAKLFCLNGTILTALLLSFPANELTLPLILTLSSVNSPEQIPINALSALAVCIAVLFRGPCATAFLTVRRETGSLKDAFLSLLLPSAFGAVLLLILKLFSLIFA